MNSTNTSREVGMYSTVVAVLARYSSLARIAARSDSARLRRVS
jgi:hypothetical protein